jgi:hypothetical protein
MSASAKAGSDFENARPAHAAPVVCRKFRLFICFPLARQVITNQLFETAAGGLEDVDSSEGAHGFVDDENTRMAFVRQAAQGDRFQWWPDPLKPKSGLNGPPSYFASGSSVAFTLT